MLGILIISYLLTDWVTLGAGVSSNHLPASDQVRSTERRKKGEEEGEEEEVEEKKSKRKEKKREGKREKRTKRVDPIPPPCNRPQLHHQSFRM